MAFAIDARKRSNQPNIEQKPTIFDLLPIFFEISEMSLLIEILFGFDISLVLKVLNQNLPRLGKSVRTASEK